MTGISSKLRAIEESTPPSLRLVTAPAMTGQTWRRGEEQTHELQLSFDELTLIYKSLQAAKALGALPPQDELLSDTMQLVDQALNAAA